MRLVVLFFILIIHVDGANWLMIQGTQKKVGTTPWGFFQVRSTHNYGSVVIENGINKTPFSYVPPKVQERRDFSLARFRLGLRGSLDSENNINYFVLTEFAPNGINTPLGQSESVYLTDASITLKHLPVYIRAGKFKYPGSEEGLMTRFASPFIEFTTMSDQLLLERFVDASLSKPSAGVGAFRDSGVELFQSLGLGEDSELTFAYMYGNGSGVENKNLNRGEATHYGYMAFEKSLGGGAGYKKESLKLYGWLQSGKRYLEQEQRFYQRERQGLGATYFYKDLHLEAEYAQGEGMIANGVRDTNSDPAINDWEFVTLASKENRASGYYFSGIYGIHKDIDILFRYDRYDRITNNKKLYRVFETYTTGFSYKLKNYTRIDVNYDFRTISAPHNSVAGELLNAGGDRLSVQFTLLMK